MTRMNCRSVFFDLADGTVLHAFSYGQRFGPKRILTLECWRSRSIVPGVDPVELWLILNCRPVQHRGMALGLLAGTVPPEVAFDYLKDHGTDQLCF